MTSLLAVGLAAVINSCSWDNPGHNPFMGDVALAVDHYKDIPEQARIKLKERIRLRKWDDIAVITKNNIEGKNRYLNLRQMHFGNNSVCNTITTSKWSNNHQERGLVYCEELHCIIIPTVCRNVSRVDLVVKSKPVAKADEPKDDIDFETAAGPVTGSFASGGGGSTPDPTPLSLTTSAGTLQSVGPQPSVYTPPDLPPWQPVSSTPYIPPNIPAVSEPKTLLLTLMGLFCIIYVLRRKNHGST